MAEATPAPQGPVVPSTLDPRTKGLLDAMNARPRPPQPTVPWWHMFHKWTQWEQRDSEVGNMALKAFSVPRLVQVRHCVTCNFMQVCDFRVSP